ncbi:crinkler family protein [Gigaspora margarita]|uniref:Crinkler family protein n=1 Tax=Gigaspora margarita TaxID=4874 RepID=A0A8H4AJC6_GIGMA|nr:crinkler family protein [Gigaspora margarita]
MENNESFDSFWKEQVGETWTNCLQCKTPTDVLIDEAQILYGKATFFWTAIKSLQDRPNSNLRMMLLSMYSDCPTINGGSHYIPVKFGHVLGMEQLRHEYDELVENHYFTAIERTRVFDWVMNLELTNDNYNFLRNTYYKVDANSTFIVDPLDEIARKFKRSGLITEAIVGCYQFSAPIVRIILGSKLFKAQTSLTRSIQDFDSFLLLSIERMRPLTLAKSLSHHNKVNAHLIERQWQTEWLIAAMTAVPSGSSIRPDVGPVYGTQGYLGFYIDGDLNWGVEQRWHRNLFWRFRKFRVSDYSFRNLIRNSKPRPKPETSPETSVSGEITYFAQAKFPK